MMHDRLRRLERDRREALWLLDALRPGDPMSWPILDRLDAVEAALVGEGLDDRDGLTVTDLVLLVPVIRHGRRLPFVRDLDIPQPWRERFNLASTGSTRYPEGYYLRDWQSFLEMWAREMSHLVEHKKARV